MVDGVTGADLRRARESKRWGIDKLARQIDVSKGHLSKVERGIDGRKVTDELIQAYKDALRVPIIAATSASGAVGMPNDSSTKQVASPTSGRGVPPEGNDRDDDATAESSEAECAAEPQQAWGQQGPSGQYPAAEQAVTVEDMKRRTAMVMPVLGLASAMAGSAEPWQRLAGALDHVRPLDDQTVECLESCTLGFFHREEHTPARQLAADLGAHIERVERLVRGAPGSYMRRLLVTTGEALALAGWLAFDCKNQAQAEALYDRALQAARQADDGPLAACVLAYWSYLAEAAGDTGTARGLLVEAQTYVHGQHSAATRAWLAAREAEVDAARGEETLALRALDRAMTAYDYAHPYRERPWTGFFTPTRLGSMAITTYARLDHAELDATTDSVIASLPATDAKIKAVVLADVATAAIQRGQHDRGAQFAYDALTATLAQEASLGRQRLYGLHLTIRDKHDVAVLAELDDRLVAYTV